MLMKEIADIARKVYNSMNPVIWREGTVISVDPLRIQVSEKLILDQGEFSCSETFHEKWQDDLKSGQYVLIGQRVLMLREQGGQKYCAIDRVMET
jgi:hypothetical protein